MTKEELEEEAEEWLDERYLKDMGVRKPCKRAYLAGAEPREKRIVELEAQIEKMKCCYNCKHSRTEYEHCKTDKHEKWEIKQ